MRVPAVKSISPIDLTSRGEIVKFKCRSFVAGVLPVRVAEEMAVAAEQGEVWREDVIRYSFIHSLTL